MISSSPLMYVAQSFELGYSVTGGTIACNSVTFVLQFYFALAVLGKDR